MTVYELRSILDCLPSDLPVLFTDHREINSVIIDTYKSCGSSIVILLDSYNPHEQKEFNDKKFQTCSG